MVVLSKSTVPLHGFTQIPKVASSEFYPLSVCVWNMGFLYLLMSIHVIDQYLIFGTEDGIYTLNLNELHEATMEQVIANLWPLSVATSFMHVVCASVCRLIHVLCEGFLCISLRNNISTFSVWMLVVFQLFPRRCTWLYVINNNLMSLSGKWN